MARYRGPKSKISRKFKIPIFGHCKELKKRPFPPGQHGKNRRRKVSDYGLQLAEKQKAKYMYGILEKQFRNLFVKASRKKGVTGNLLLQLLESRLDNTVYRLGISPTRRGARQLVSHYHITVNGKRNNIPSYLLKPGDTISLTEKSKKLENVTKSLAARPVGEYNWLDWSEEKMTGQFLQYPERARIPEPIKEQVIVELYSK